MKEEKKESDDKLIITLLTKILNLLEAKPFHESDEWLNSNKMTLLLGISDKTLRNYTEQGIFTPVKVGKQLYFRRSEVFPNE